MLQIRRIVAVSLTLMVSMTAMASGGGGYNDSYSQPRKVDKVYEHGKSIYNGRINGNAIQYCIDNGAESVRIKRRTIKQLKSKSYKALEASLHNCSKPEQSITSLLNSNDLYAVVYYLNKRYKLNLSKN